MRECLSLALLVAGLVTMGDVARGQTGMIEYDTCVRPLPLGLERLKIERHIFACSRIAGDAALPDDVRATAYTYRGYYSYVRTGFVGQFEKAGGADEERAFADFSEAIRLNPKSAAPYYYRGNIFIGKDDNRAIADLTRAIELDFHRTDFGKYETPYHARAIIYESRGDKERAIADYRKALESPAGTLFRELFVTHLKARA